MFTIFSRIVHYGFENFWRNGWLSTATVAVMILALLVLMGLILFNVVTERAVATIQEKIDISVYFKTNTPEDQILSVKESIEGLAEVKSVDYVSRDRALEIFKKNHADEQTISQAIAELNTNPLEAHLNIKAKNPDQYETIAEYFTKNQNLNNIVSSVSYYKNQVVIGRLNAVIKNVNGGGLALTVALTLLACLVIFNTIRLAIYSSRDEIGVMRVVGASNSLVRGPFMVEGIIVGVLAAVLSLIVAAPIIYTSSPYLQNVLPGFSLSQYFFSNLFTFIWYQFLFGIALGGFSGFIAVRRYLKN